MKAQQNLLHQPFSYIKSTAYDMIPGSQGRKSDASLFARGFSTLGPAKNMNKKPFFAEK